MQRKFFLLACLLVCADCFAQQYPFVYYTPKDGLINSRVRSIRQDTKGRMYFLTHGGLSVYDGKRFTNYHTQDGLANELVNDIIEVGPDSFLLATNVSTLNTLVRGRVDTFKTADNFCPVINRFFKSNDGYWYAAADEGLYRLEKNRFVKLMMKDDNGIEIGCCLDRIIEWKNFFVLVPWNDELKEKLLVYDRTTGKVTDTETEINTTTSASIYQGQFWISTTTGLRLLDTAALSKGQLSFLPVPAKYRAIGVEKKDMLMEFDAANKAWFCHGGVITIFSASQIQVIKAGPGLKNYAIADMFMDREGSMWMATDGNGIMKLRNTNIELINSINQQTLACQGITHHKDTVWFFNVPDNSIYRFASNRFTRFPLYEKAGACNLAIWNNRIYQSTAEKMFCIENKDDPDSYRHPKTIIKARPNVRYGHGLINSDGTIIQYGLEGQSTYMLYVLKNDNIVSRNQISHAADQINFDKKGRMWLSTRDHRIWAFSTHPEQPEKYLQLIKGYPKEIPHIAPRSITADTNNNIWIGTRYEGIYQYEIKNDELVQVAQYTTQHGLTDNFVGYLTCDDNNTIWAGTQTGIDKIYRKNEKYIIGNISESNNFFQSIFKIVIDDDHTVWGLTSEGVLKISASGLPPIASQAPPLLLTSLEVNNHPYHESVSTLSYNQNNLSFSVAAPSYIDERSIQYSYLLQGSGIKTWSVPSNNASFNFINLSPGNYTLKVKADFPEMSYPSQEMSYSFSIKPPWWQTLWFRLLVIAILMAIAALLVRSYIRRKLEKQRMVLERKQAIEKERTRIATDMHDELGAGLSRIKFLSETIGIKKQKQEAVEEDIDKIRQYSHEMIDKMGEIVWALNEKNDSLSDLLAYTRVYAVQYLAENGIECTMDTPTQFPSNVISGEFRRNVYLTVKEALHNIVKHAQARQVNIHIQTGKELLISISDDGVGFNQSSIRPYGNGLNNMRKRIESISGKLHFNNGKGTTVVFSVPLA
jgi:signal transduction histidine kinase/ligand-binding sensor domain-containing protein